MGVNVKHGTISGAGPLAIDRNSGSTSATSGAHACVVIVGGASAAARPRVTTQRLSQRREVFESHARAQSCEDVSHGCRPRSVQSAWPEDGMTLLVEQITGGLVGDWNAAHPESKVASGVRRGGAFG